MNRARALAALLLLAALPARGQEASPEESPLDANKALVRRYLEEVLSGGDLSALDQLVSGDYVDSSPGADRSAGGPELVRRSQQQLRALFKDITYSVDRLLAEGDEVVARYTVRAVYAPKGGSPAAGRAARVFGMTVFRIEGGKIRESWTINDQLGMFEQLGFTLKDPEPEKPAEPAEPPPEPAKG